MTRKISQDGSGWIGAFPTKLIRGSVEDRVVQKKWPITLEAFYEFEDDARKCFLTEVACFKCPACTHRVFRLFWLEPEPGLRLGPLCEPCFTKKATREMRGTVYSLPSGSFLGKRSLPWKRTLPPLPPKSPVISVDSGAEQVLIGASAVSSSLHLFGDLSKKSG